MKNSTDPAVPSLIDVYPYRITEHGAEYLLLRRSEDKIYAGQWRMVGAKVNQNEPAWKAALRELREETGIIPVKFWALPSVNTFYEAKTDRIHHIPAFAAEVDAKDAEVTLNAEHTDYRWEKCGAACNLVRWPEQQRLISLADRLINSSQILPDWIINQQI